MELGEKEWDENGGKGRMERERGRPEVAQFEDFARRRRRTAEREVFGRQKMARPSMMWREARKERRGVGLWS